MESVGSWWQGLQPINHWFFLAAIFFSVFALWQLISAIIGLGGGEVDLDTHVDPSFEHHSPGDAAETLSAFKLISLRSVIAFFSLFSWAGALYLMTGTGITLALVYAFIWGIAALLLVSFLLYLMRRATHTGNLRIESAIGMDGTVYLDWLDWGGTPEVVFGRPAHNGRRWLGAWVQACSTVWPEGAYDYRVIQNECTGLLIQGAREAWGSSRPGADAMHGGIPAPSRRRGARPPSACRGPAPARPAGGGRAGPFASRRRRTRGR